MQALPLHEEEWEYVRTLLPSDLEESARKTNALLRCRNVPDAAALMRLALAYAVSDLSLKDVAAWASALDVAQITGPGAFYRLRESEVWLEQVLGQVLGAQVPQAAGGWRAVELTDDSGGEKLGRHHFRPGEVVLGDRAYATARGVHAVRRAEAHVIARFNPGNLRTCDAQRQRILLVEKEGEIPVVGVVEYSVTIPVPPEPTKSHKSWNS